MPIPGFGDHVHLAAEEAQLDRGTPALQLLLNAVRNQPEFTCVLGQNLAYRNSESGLSKGLPAPNSQVFLVLIKIGRESTSILPYLA